MNGFSPDRYKSVLMAALVENEEMQWKDITYLATKFCNFPEDGNYLVLRGILQELINGGFIERVKDVHTERYCLKA